MVLTLEEGLDLTLEVTIRKVVGGCSVVMSARYSVTGRPFAGAVELASQGAARRETARACEQLAARFGRKRTTPGAQQDDQERARPTGDPREPRPVAAALTEADCRGCSRMCACTAEARRSMSWSSTSSRPSSSSPRPGVARASRSATSPRRARSPAWSRSSIRRTGGPASGLDRFVRRAGRLAPGRHDRARRHRAGERRGVCP